MTSKLKVDEIVNSTDTGSPSFPYGVTFAGAVSGTSASLSGNLTFTGTGNRITGDFSNATLANRVMFQSSVTNGATQIAALPNGSGTSSNFGAHNASDPTNASRARIQVTSAEASFISDISGTGTYLPMTFYTGGIERARIDTSGNVGIGTSSPSSKLDVVGTLRLTNTINAANYGLLSDLGGLYIQSLNSNPMYFATGGSERMRIDSSGNVGIGTSSPGARLNVFGSDTTGFVGIAAQNSNLNTGIAGIEFGSDPTYKKAAIGLVRSAANGVGSIVFFNDSNTDAANWSGGDEKMRIDSSGNLLVGRTASIGSAKFLVKASTTGTGAWVTYTANTADAVLFGVLDNGGISTGSFTSSPYNLTTGSAANMYVASDGILYRSTSSLKYKTDVQDAAHGLADVLKLRSVTYKAKNDGDTVFGGLIAEEVHEAGLTEFVQYAADGSPDAIHYGNMVALLAKSIQEQQQMINELRNEIAALKGA